MDTFRMLLQRIRERPALYLGEKSFTKLVYYKHGYMMREHVECWEKLTGCAFIEHVDEAIHSTIPKSEVFPIYEFNKFIIAHYGCKLGTTSGDYLISINSNSEEEAFDKYLELYDEFCAMKGITIPTLPDPPPRKTFVVESCPRELLPESVQAWIEKCLKEQSDNSHDT